MEIDWERERDVKVKTEPVESETKMDIEQTEKGEDVDMTGRPFSDYSMLFQYNKIHQLIWKNLSSEELFNLFNFYHDANVRILNVSRDKCDLAQLTELKSEVLGLKQLTVLNISGTLRLSTKKLVHTLVSSFPHLVDLNVSCTGLTDVTPLAKLTALQSLNVSHNYLNDGDAKSLATEFKLLSQLDISHNELTNEGLLQFLNNHTIRQLNVSEQRAQTISPDTQQLVAEHIVPRQQDIKVPERESDFEFIPSNTSLDNTLKYNPNTINIRVVNVDDFENDNLPNFHFKRLLRFKHLQRLAIGPIDYHGWFLPVKKTIRFVAHHPTCHELHLLHLDLTDQMGFARALAKNEVLKTVLLRQCYAHLDFMKLLISNRSIERLIVHSWMRPNPEHILAPLLNHDLLVPLLMENKTLTSVEGRYFGTNPNYLQVEGIDELLQHLEQNKQRKQVINQVVPLLAAIQHGGALRHSAIDLMPMIFRFAGQTVPSREQLKETSETIEPVVRIGQRRTRQTQDPLPFMFTKLMK